MYNLHLCHFYTSPGLAWQACLKMTDVELDLLTDPHMYLVMEEGLLGGISMISNRFCKANSLYVPNYNHKKLPMRCTSTPINYLDVVCHNLFQPMSLTGLLNKKYPHSTSKDLQMTPSKVSTEQVFWKSISAIPNNYTIFTTITLSRRRE